VEISAKAEYALRAMLCLAAHDPEMLKITQLIEEQRLPKPFLEGILGELRRARLVRSQRGATGGYGLGRSADSISIGDVVRAVDGSLTEVRGQLPQDLHYDGHAQWLAEVLVAVQASVEAVLDHTTLADVETGLLPQHVRELAASAAARRLISMKVSEIA
jgi:Rrf2 family protein